MFAVLSQSFILLKVADKCSSYGDNYSLQAMGNTQKPWVTDCILKP